jgi:hypothetical protein
MSVIVEYQNQLHNRINPRNLRRYVDSFLKWVAMAIDSPRSSSSPNTRLVTFFIFVNIWPAALWLAVRRVQMFRLRLANVSFDAVWDADSENVQHRIYSKWSSGPTDRFCFVTAIYIEQRHWPAADFLFQLYTCQICIILTLPESWDREESNGTHDICTSLKVNEILIN